MAFKQPTLRTRKRALRLRFQDESMPMGSGALDEPDASEWAVAKRKASAMSQDPNWVSPPPLKGNTKDITVTVPFDWNQYQIVQYLGELARQGAAKFEQLPHSVPKGYEQVSFGEDASPTDLTGMPTGDPTSTTTGGSAGPGMLGDPVASYPTANKQFGYWIITKPDSINVIRRDYGANGFAEVVGRFPTIEDTYYSFDVSTTHWNLYRTSRQTADLGDTRPGIAQGRAAAQVTGDRRRQIQTINKANAAIWRRS